MSEATTTTTPLVANVDNLITLSRKLDAAKAKAERTRKDITTLTKRAAKEDLVTEEVAKEYDAMKTILDAGQNKTPKAK